jgi:cell division protein FtsL
MTATLQRAPRVRAAAAAAAPARPPVPGLAPPARRPRPSRPPLRVVEPRRRLRTGPTVVLGAVLAFGIAFAVVVFQAQLVQGQRNLDDLNERIDLAADEYRQLRWEVADLESPDRIVDAAGALGMVTPPGVTYLTPTGSVVVDDEDDPVATIDGTSEFADTKPYLDGAG